MHSMDFSHTDKRTLSIQKGMELQVYVSTEISSQDSVMYQTYCQSIRALSGIVQQTKAFYEVYDKNQTSEERLDELLFPFSSNIIAFTGPRGVGKTRTMLSISRKLQNGLDEKDALIKRMDLKTREDLTNARFVVIPPISPSVMEEKQNILYVILTRLFRYAEEMLDAQDCRSRRKLEDQREMLYHAFQDCYSGINGLKQDKRESHGDLMELQDLRDGLILRRHFYNLVSAILANHPGKHSFLVVQLDDADSQIKNGYEVLEDVRKYLQIPNLVILMSTDVDMLQDVILQDYFRQFPDRKNDIGFRHELIKSCRKYIDKLIPPSYMIHLPSLGMILQSYSDIKLEYKDWNGELVYPWASDLDLQDTVLMEIYRKTGVLFVRPSGYVHYIVPTTLRGLNQLLYLLSRMKELPKLEADKNNFASAWNLAEAVSERIKLEDENLNLFFDYFTDDWVKVKVANEQDQKFLKKLREENGRMFVQITVEYLYERYQKSRVLDGLVKRFNQPFLDKLMAALAKEHGTQEDHYLFFSIRTIFTLNHHKMVLRQKRDAVRSFRRMQDGRGEDMPRYFAVDYDPAVTFLPRTYLVNSEIRRLELGRSSTLENQREYYKDTLDEVERARKSCRKAENDVQKRSEELNTAKKAASEMERELKELTQEAAVADKNAVARRNAAEEAALQVQLLEAEMPANLGVLIGSEVKDVSLGAEFYQKYARAKVLKTEAKKRADTALAQASMAKKKLDEEKTRYKAHLQKLPRLKEKLENAKKQAEIRNNELETYEDVCEKELEDLEKIVKILEPSAEEHQRVAMIHPVFDVPVEMQLGFDLMFTTDDVGTAYGVEENKKFFYECMVTENSKETGCEVNFMNFITFLLRLGKQGAVGDQQPENVDPVWFQQRLYMIQECALMVASNWDVQDTLYHDLALLHSYLDLDVDLLKLYEMVDGVLRGINGGMVYAYHMNEAGMAGGTASEDGISDQAWGILQGYKLFDAEGKYHILPFVNRERLLKNDIFDLEDEQFIPIPDEPQEYDPAGKPNFD